ncbi:MAG TPA: hypothetical protein DEA32_02545 [Firmicutes bacterium]|mgnify:CR=1 FL=1|nr:hypothetical protein [Bacillota bacterium]
MLARFLGKIADLNRKHAALYILVLVLFYLIGMTLVILGVVLRATPEQWVVPELFYPGITIWIPTCIMTILTSISSNFSREIHEKEADGSSK